jgi:uncharacterized membrane protein
MSRALRVDLSGGTILKILGALAAVWLWLRLWWWILLFVAADRLAPDVVEDHRRIERKEEH